MITAHPSESLKATTHYMIAWLSAVALLVGLALFSGRTAVGIAVGVLFGAALVIVARMRSTDG